MITGLFFTILRSVAIPYVAYILLRESALEEKGAILAIAIALVITNGIAIIWNIIKIIPNTVLLRSNTVLKLTLDIGIQLASVGFVWYVYLSRYTDVIS